MRFVARKTVRGGLVGAVCIMDMDPTSDVDRDGKPDLAELADGQDPNDPATDAPRRPKGSRAPKI